MPDEITMPKLSDTMEEGTLLKWFKKEGDYIRQGEALFEVETDKAVMEVESFVSGVISQILVQEGEKVPVGTPLALIGGETGKVVPQDEPLMQEPPKTMPPQKTSLHEVKGHPKLKVVPPKGKRLSAGTDSMNASPAAKTLAEQRGVDLAQIEGTGPGGMITLKDVRDFRKEGVREAGNLPRASRGVLPTEEITGLSSMRKAIAATVSYSKQHIPHFYISYEIAMNTVVTQLEDLNRGKSGGDKITVNDVIIRAAATTLKKYPYLNALYPEQGLILRKEVNMGIVIGLDEGLIIPVLKNSDTLTLGEISQGVKRLREKAQSGKFSADDLSDGTFTISNLGMLGVSDFAAIIYPPQTGILAVSAVKEIPVIKDGSVVPMKVMKVTLSMDHRVVDGINAAHFLRDLQKSLETDTLEVMDKPCCTVEDD